MTENEALRVVGHLLEHHGTAGNFALDMSGNAVEPESRDANAYCLVGAVRAVNCRLRCCAGWYAERTLRHARELFGVATDVELQALWDRSHYDDTERARIIARLKTAGLEAR